MSLERNRETKGGKRKGREGKKPQIRVAGSGRGWFFLWFLIEGKGEPARIPPTIPIEVPPLWSLRPQDPGMEQEQLPPAPPRIGSGVREGGFCVGISPFLTHSSLQAVGTGTSTLLCVVLGGVCFAFSATFTSTSSHSRDGAAGDAQGPPGSIHPGPGEGNGRGGTIQSSTFHLACGSGSAPTNPTPPRLSSGGGEFHSVPNGGRAPPLAPPGPYIQCLSAVSMAQQWQCKSTLGSNAVVLLGSDSSRAEHILPWLIRSLKTQLFHMDFPLGT